MKRFVLNYLVIATIAVSATFTSCVKYDDGSGKQLQETISSLFEKWNTVTVTFNSNGGSNVSPQNVVQGGKAIKPDDPTRTGFVFDGWYTDDTTFVNEWNFTANTVTANVILYAKWLLFNYVAIENFGNQFDYAILGKNGDGYFYELQDKKSNVPQRFTIYDGNKNKVELVINFDENGLPKNILSEDFTVVLGNYEGKRFDAVIITKEGVGQIFENIETDISWQEYMNGIGISGGASRASELMIVSKSYDPVFDFLQKWVNPLIKGFGCAFSIATVNPIGIIMCGLNLGEAFGLWDTPQLFNDIDFLNDFLDLASCSSSYLECLVSIAGLVTYGIDNRANSSNEAIIIGDKFLITGGKHMGGPGVYVAGFERNAQNINVAKLWKDGMAQDLTDGKTNAVANSVYVVGDDVIVAGMQGWVATLWINGVALSLNGTSAQSVYVYDDNVYVAGYEYYDFSDRCAAKMWINQLRFDLSSGTYANSIFVSGGDVYVAGQQVFNLLDYPYAILWKNGDLLFRPLTVSHFDISGNSANSVFVSGSDVYVAGRANYNNSAILWKNGIGQYLDHNGASANSVFVLGNDVYVSGNNNNGAILWKNGAAQMLDNGLRYASSVFASGSDVYVAGSGLIPNSAKIRWLFLQNAQIQRIIF